MWRDLLPKTESDADEVMVNTIHVYVREIALTKGTRAKTRNVSRAKKSNNADYEGITLESLLYIKTVNIDGHNGGETKRLTKLSDRLETTTVPGVQWFL